MLHPFDEVTRLSPFDEFCLSHVCASWLRGADNYCPLADEIRAKHRTITGNDCKAEFERMKKKGEKT